MGEWTVHGGRLRAARAAWPDAPAPWLDLSTGINPHPWPVDRAAAIDWTRLPDEGDLAALEGAAAEAFDVSPDRVCATPGSEIAIRSLGALSLPLPFRHVEPGYRSHGEALAGSIATPPEAIDRVRDGTLLLANPANPQGDDRPLGDLAERLAQAGGRLIVDEAFADAMPRAALPPESPAIRLRSFGKFYGLAGVRLGFVIAPPEEGTAIRRRIGSWPVSAAALAIGTAAYRDRDWQETMRRRLADEAASLDRTLARHGLMAEGACPLFRLVRHEHAPALFERLARSGILTRPFDHAPGWLRFGLPGSAENLDRLDRALAGG